MTTIATAAIPTDSNHGGPPPGSGSPRRSARSLASQRR
jgi:hypothetical protein